MCVCALNSGRGSLQNLTQVCDTEQLYSGRIKYITTDVPPASKGLFTQKGGWDGERGGMAVIQYQTIEHLNLKIGYSWRSFSCHISFATKGLLWTCFFYIGKKCKKSLKNSLDFQMFQIIILAGLPNIKKKYLSDYCNCSILGNNLEIMPMLV